MRRFNVRVYGLIFNENNEVLLSDEFEHGVSFTKFPGGGLEFGEGVIDCLKRECMEELGQEVIVEDHFYTTDFYQVSAFNKNEQLLSIYYKAKLLEAPKFKLAYNPSPFLEMVDGRQLFRWKNLADLDELDVTFPIDQKVVTMLKSN